MTTETGIVQEIKRCSICNKILHNNDDYTVENNKIICEDCFLKGMDEFIMDIF